MQSKAQAATNTQRQQVDGLEKSELARMELTVGGTNPRQFSESGSLEASRRRQGKACSDRGAAMPVSDD